MSGLLGNWNLFFLALGWHNNHHAHQQVAEAGHKWWEFDPTMMVIRVLKRCGLATKIKSIKDQSVEPDLRMAG